MEKARRTTLEVTYKGVNISTDVSADLVGFTFTDNESSKAGIKIRHNKTLLAQAGGVFYFQNLVQCPNSAFNW